MTLDGLAFPSEKTDNYLFEGFADGEIPVPSEYNLTSADRTLVSFTSTDKATGEQYKLYGVYIGDMATISVGP